MPETTSEYLLEIRCQELPASRQLPLLEAIGHRLFEELMSRGLVPEEMLTGVTPRRLMLAVRGLPAAEPARRAPELGPPAAEAWDDNGRPTEVLEGFAARLEVEVDAVERLHTERGEYAGLSLERPGRSVREMLAEIVPRVVAEGARRLADSSWGDPGWPRPVEGVVSLLDGETLPLAVGGVEAVSSETAPDDGMPAITVPHAVHAPDPVPIDGVETYREALASRGVVVSWVDRRRRVRAALDAAADEHGGTLSVDDRLLDHMTGSCEVPRVFVGRLPVSRLDAPSELVTALLADRLGAATVRDEESFDALEPEDDLLPLFLTVVDRPDAPSERIVRGFERAASSHLEDLHFLLESDRRLALAARAGRLEQLTVHESLGTWADKTRRLRSLVERACDQLGANDVLDSLLDAVLLLKTDLTTGTVAALPEQRGVVGGLMARREGYVAAVWQTIYDQYLPRGLDDPIPCTLPGRIVAVCDRLDSLVGWFGLDERPPTRTLRTLAQGLLRVVIDGDMPLDLDLLAARAALLYGALERPVDEVLRDVQAFLDDRLDQLLGRRGFAYDEIHAAKAVGRADLPALVRRIEALRAIRAEPGFRSLVQASKRIAGILEGGEADAVDPAVDPTVDPHAVDTTRFEHDAEHELLAALEAADGPDDRPPLESLRAMMSLVEPLDRFFADAHVMSDDAAIRANRIALLRRCRRLVWRVARLKDLTETPAGGTS